MGKKKNSNSNSNSNDDVSPSTNPSVFIGSSVIPIINKLQDIFAPLGDIDDRLTGLRLPQVAVIGSQSSGKSSVLEALVGRDFLPRGSDICTRRPLVLQLVKRSDGIGNDSLEWGEFGHLPEKRFYDFSAIRREILAETEKEVGVNKGVSDKQIRLKIYSPNVLNITLVDLPGITKVPVGDQPSDIEARIRNMIMSYIKQETSIILAVSPANADLANSDALQLAKKVDPTGTRTIGVITKLDIMDKGTDARNFLLGKVIPLHLGYIGVVNRCQEDINNNRPIREALAYEEKFFRDYHVYHGLSDRCGIPKLAKKLNQILEQHIRNVLPNLKTDLTSHLVAVEKELCAYGEALESNGERGPMLLNILTKYSEAFSAEVDGKSQTMTTKELSGGARIHHIFQSIFVKSLEEVDPCEDLSDEDIRIAIHNATGPRNALFVPEVPFEVLVRRQIARLLDPSLQCLRFVYDELIKISRACETVEMRRFSELRRRLEDVTARFLRDGVKPAERMIKSLIDMEEDYINSSHPNFIGGTKAVDVAQNELRAMQNFKIFRAKRCKLFQWFSTVMSTSDWCKLPVELLGLIASRLHFPEDWVRFGAVCKLWRICIIQNGYSSCSFLPWLMLPQMKHESLRRFYSPFNSKSYDIHLPDVLDKRCWGSSHGWLVTLGANFEMHLLNPLSGAQISLPPLHKCPNLNLICTGKSFRDSFVYKVILSASPCSSDCVIFAIYSDNWKMAFTKPGDVAWTPLSCIHGHVDDAMCHDGKFYAIDTFGEILMWDLAGSLVKRIAFPPSRDLDNLVYATTYLVEVKGQIYAVMRLLFDTRITDTPCLNTWCFKIYKLDVCNETCEEVKSLDDWSIFVGNNHSFSIQCSAYPECASNCIYFTDDFSGVHYDVVHGYDMGIYDVQNLRVQPLQEDISDFAFSLPLWIIPSLS